MFRSDTLIWSSDLRSYVRVVLFGFFRGSLGRGITPPYAEKVRFRWAGIKKAHAVILCCYNNQTVHRRTA